MTDEKVQGNIIKKFLKNIEKNACIPQKRVI